MASALLLVLPCNGGVDKLTALVDGHDTIRKRHSLNQPFMGIPHGEPTNGCRCQPLALLAWAELPASQTWLGASASNFLLLYWMVQDGFTAVSLLLSFLLLPCPACPEA